MSLNLIAVTNPLTPQKSMADILSCNNHTKSYGLTLTEQQAIELVQARANSLAANRRVEFAGNIVEKLLMEFCPSPYIFQSNYVETISELIEMFYFFKNETLDILSDDELIQAMKGRFDGRCQGSLDLLKHRELEKIAGNIRRGLPPDYDDDAQEHPQEGTDAE